MLIDKNRIERRFKEYVKDYDDSNPKVRLKIDHTFRVAKLCMEIAKDQGWKEDDCDIAWTIGMLHDIGRFEQLRQYNTFEDARSIDHAELGCKILFEEGRIKEYVESTELDEIIDTAIRWHSSYRIPDSLPPMTAAYCNVLRDADKIDILRVNATIPLRDIYDVTQEAIETCDITPIVRESFYEKHATKRSIKVTPMDYVVAHCSLAFELVYPISRRIVVEDGYLLQLMKTPSVNPATVKTLEELREFLFAELTTK